MELIKKKNVSVYEIYKRGDEGFGRHLITVHSKETPDDFDPDRTARMIEKMEEMEEALEWVVQAFDLDGNGRFLSVDSKLHKKRKAILSYIKNGDKKQGTEILRLIDELREKVYETAKKEGIIE